MGSTTDCKPAVHPHPLRGDEPRMSDKTEVSECPVCNQQIKDGEVVVFLHGDLLHIKCWQDTGQKPTGRQIPPRQR
jgi:hypothetical protein